MSTRRLSLPALVVFFLGAAAAPRALAQGCVTATAGGALQNTPFAAQTGTFTATFDARPSGSFINATMGLSNNAQTSNTGLAAIVRFNTAGRIDARNGGGYAAAAAIPYSAGLTYRFRLAVNVPAHTYSVFVTPPGAAERTVGSNFAFRNGQGGVPRLNSRGLWAGTGSNVVCNLAISGGGGGADFSMSTTPPTPLTINAGAVVRYTIGVTGRNGFGGTVALSASGLPPASTVVFIPASITGSGVSTMEIVTSTSSPGGTYNITATGTASGLPPRTTPATLIITGGTSPDFSLSASPSSRSVNPGAATSYAVTITRTGGFSGAVAMSVSGLPAGTSGSFSPASVTGTASTLNVSTTASTPPGTFNLTIRGASGALARTTTVSLSVGGGGGTACPTCTHKRLKVVNGCGQPMWIMYHTGFNGGVLNAPNRQLLPGLGSSIEYDIPDKGLAGTRFWPGMGCDAGGHNCQIGASGGPANMGFTCPATIGCAPSVDSKFEGTFGCITGVADGQCQGNPSGGGAPLPRDDYWNTSMVDGYTLPVEVIVHGFCPPGNPGGPAGGRIDCSNLTFGDCPTSEDLSTNGQFPALGNQSLLLRHPNTNAIVGCYSPASKLTMVHWQSAPRPPFFGTTYTPQDPQARMYACPTPPVSVEQCRQGPVVNTDFVQLIHARCNNTYAYAYDDVMGLSKCPSATNLSYEVTFFCPR